ncbi:MAG: cation:proton antiporter [Gammaproteobacteria bacterium]|nr:cation:proton antiporter [Gammaproteobacteria bacterium]
MHQDIVFTIFLIFTGAAALATLALYTRQALLVAYILLGVLLGPSVFGLVNDPKLIGNIAHIGIIFLLFLMGLELNPKDFLLLMRKTTVLTLASSVTFLGIGGLLALWFGYTHWEALLIGAAMIFSSTIIGLKLLPTTVLHHQRTGEIIISILLLQDFIAILLLLVLEGSAAQEYPVLGFFKVALALPLLIGFAVFFVQKVLLRLLQKFDTFHEYIFLLAIGWCLGMAEAAAALGISQEIGAFVGGVTLASSPISLYMSENLKPLRDFFLVMFFFSLGAGFDLSMLGTVILPASLFALLTILGKPPVFKYLLKKNGESETRSGEVGMRLGQLSEFSLLIAVLALERGRIGLEASYLIQLATLLTFFASTYLVVMRYPTPIALSDELRRN